MSHFNDSLLNILNLGIFFIFNASFVYFVYLLSKLKVLCPIFAVYSQCPQLSNEEMPYGDMTYVFHPESLGFA